MSILSISELALWVEDVDRSLAWYRKNLGFALESHEPGKHAFLKGGDFLLVLFNPKNPGTKLADEYLARKGAPAGMVYHAAFRVAPEELDSFAEGIKARGVEVKGPVEFATGRRSYFLEDLDDHYIELTDC